MTVLYWTLVVYSLFGATANITLLLCGVSSVAVGCFVIAVIAIVKHLKGITITTEQEAL